MIASVLFLSLFIFLIPPFSLDGSFMVVVVAFRSSSSTLFLILFSYLLLMNSYTYWNELTIAYSETGLLLSLLVFLSLSLSRNLAHCCAHCTLWRALSSHILFIASQSFVCCMVFFLLSCWLSALLIHLIFIVASHIWMRTTAFCLLFTRIDYQYIRTILLLSSRSWCPFFIHRHHPIRRSFKSIALLLLLIFFFQFVELNFNSYLKREMLVRIVCVVCFFPSGRLIWHLYVVDGYFERCRA